MEQVPGNSLPLCQPPVVVMHVNVSLDDELETKEEGSSSSHSGSDDSRCPEEKSMVILSKRRVSSHHRNQHRAALGFSRLVMLTIPLLWSASYCCSEARPSPESSSSVTTESPAAKRIVGDDPLEIDLDDLIQIAHVVEQEAQQQHHQQQQHDYETNGADKHAQYSGNEVERYHSEFRSAGRTASTKQQSASGITTDDVDDDDDDDDDEMDSVILITTIDGTMAGLSRKSGKLLWKQEPLGSTQQQNQAVESSSQPPPGRGGGGGGIESTKGNIERHLHEHMRPHAKQNESTGKKNDHNSDRERIVAPLVSTTTTTKSSSGTGGHPGRTAAVPSVDGKVFLTPGREGVALGDSGTTDSTVTTEVRDLVARAPFVDRRGRVIVGSRQSSIAAIDRDTGEVLRVIGGEGNNVQDIIANSRRTTGDATTEMGQPSLDGRNVVWIGRVDNAVTFYDARSGDVDVQFSTSEVLSVGDMAVSEDLRRNNVHKGTDTGVLGTASVHLLPTTGEGSRSVSGESFMASVSSSRDPTSLLVATPNGSLALRDPDSGRIQWVLNESFDSPVAFAVDSASGNSISVDIVPDAPMPSSSKEYLSKEFERQISAMESETRIEHTHVEGGGDSTTDAMSVGETIVGALSNGQLFALPLGKGRQTSDLYNNNRGKRDALPLGLPVPHSTASSSSSAVGATKQWSKLPHSLNKQHSQHLHDISAYQHMEQHGHKYLSTNNKKACVPSSSAYPACLVGSKIGPGRKLTISGEPFLTSEQTPYDDADFELHPSYYFQQEQEQQNRHRNRFKTFLKIMSSWIPPAVALAFVVSFELGRRERQKVDRVMLSRQDTTGSDASWRINNIGNFSSGVQDMTGIQSTHTNNEGGVIQLTDEVLGYGGHGTVVYKGKLDGRNVAVKRMLKAYSASASREISLLIESDGHPNVVRYFLKEVRGDFVYLALELCDMSLQDLIVALSKHLAMKSDGKLQLSEIPPATKKALFQIASGVKHLHFLRIVHRDLKPANILFAHRSFSAHAVDNTSNVNGSSQDDRASFIYSSFEKGGYIPKISDMGLGKQLEGQSSFGMSALGNASLVGQSHDGSTLVGAGPGSVGWQAPEVMAMRWSSEASPPLPMTFRHSNHEGSETVSDESPMDVAMSARTSRSVDIFSLGCVFYCTILPGSHPFGEWYEREANIMKDKPSIEGLKNISVDAFDLVSSMIARNPKDRPTASQICEHPFFWKSTKRLGFLCEFSDRLEADLASMTDKGCVGVSPISVDVFKIERNAAQIVGTAWDTELDPDLINNVSKFRTYDPSSVRDCLRIIRNKHHHFDELPPRVKDRIGGNLDGLLQYFESKFPQLLMHCYNVCRDCLKAGDPLSSKYSIPQRKIIAIRPASDVILTTPNVSLKDETSIDISAVETHSQKLPEPIIEENHGTPSHKEIKDGVLGKPEGDEEPDTSIDHATSPPSFCEEDENQSSEDDTDVTDDNSVSMQESSAPSSTGTNIPSLLTPENLQPDSVDIVLWEGSTVARSFNCRGWTRSDDEWARRTDATLRKRDANIARCADDPKFRTRLCNHWDMSGGTFCPMRKKNKCIFAHGPIELRVKEGKRNRWGKLVDKNGNNSNPFHSGGEDTYGVARSIETMRQEKGKRNPEKPQRGKGRSNNGRKNKA
eukprot:scaffold28952_cov58-Attheya_sp.AAC.2